MRIKVLDKDCIVTMESELTIDWNARIGRITKTSTLAYEEGRLIAFQIQKRHTRRTKWN